MKNPISRIPIKGCRNINKKTIEPPISAQKTIDVFIMPNKLAPTAKLDANVTTTKSRKI